MGVGGSTQRLRPMVNPDGKVGLKISRRLIEKLDGVEAEAVVSTSSTSDNAGAAVATPAGGGGGGAGGAARGIPSDAAILADARSVGVLCKLRIPSLDSALGRSLRVGELLLKNEAEELARVREWASEMHASAHAFKPREVPCGAERDACKGCYETNAADPLKCAGEVAAYEKCATVAQKAFVAGAGR